MRVDFMMIGAQKCGTTSLASLLAAHREICFSSDKEPGYFNRVSDWRQDIDRYHQLYDPLPGQLCGEASTMYTFLPEYQNTHERLYDYNPNLKLIYLMRQPIERIVSNYAHNVVRNLESRAPEVAVFADPGYIRRTRYGVQVRPYIDLFGQDQVLLLLFEEFISDKAGTLRQVAEFLGIDPDGFEQESEETQHSSTGEYYLKSQRVESFVGSSFFSSIRGYIPAQIRQPIRRSLFSNKLEEKPQFATELRQELWRWLEDDVLAIEDLMGRSLDVWRNGLLKQASRVDHNPDDDAASAQASISLNY